MMSAATAAAAVSTSATVEPTTTTAANVTYARMSEPTRMRDSAGVSDRRVTWPRRGVMPWR